MPPRHERGSMAARAVGVSLVALLLLALLAFVAVFTFSVKVNGHSMNPTLEPGDRLFVNFLSRSEIARFDIVEVTLKGSGQHVVKRVVGLPGDTVVVRNQGRHPTVEVRPADSRQWQRVDNPSWPDQWGIRVGQRCCTADGKASDRAQELTIPAGQYWLLGDNWGGSDDSRVFGLVGKDRIGAILNVRLTPLSERGQIENRVRLVPIN